METTQDTPVQTAAPPVNPLERRLDMAVTLAEIEREVEQQLKRIAKTAKMAGFRPGKVPMKLVEKMYAGEARSEALGAAIDKAFNELVRAQNLRIAGQPRVEPKAGSEEGKLEFTAIFEVYPEFQIGDVTGKTIEKPVLTITDVEVDQTIEVLRKQRTTYAEVDRASVKGDRLIVDFTGRKNGEEFPGGKATDYPVFVGGGMMLPDFEAALEGVKSGEEKTFDVNFPEDYHAKDLAGQQVQFTVVVKKVEEPRLPEVDADFARALGIKEGDVAKMREEVKANLEREVANRLKNRVKEQAMNLLLETNPIDVPQSLVQAEAQQMAQRALEDLKQRNPQMKDMPVEASWFLDQAARRVKLGLIIAELVKSQDLHVKPEEVRAVVDEYAATFEEPQEVVRWYYSKPEMLAHAEVLAMENKVVDWVLAHAQVTEKPVAFDELMGTQA
ncbi:trigger factor [Sulfuricystis multivorans]|uniref:trigger factor n=1 Tax=Sulfuricystis multivorans TaxID=2211108 RepID=UPI000F81710C|nr:trigger factor [Sulfuricystis multivorans]